jgi:hypothetical protein
MHVIVAGFNEYTILQFHGLVSDSFVSVKPLFLSDLVNGKPNLITLFIVLNQSGSYILL